MLYTCDSRYIEQVSKQVFVKNRLHSVHFLVQELWKMRHSRLSKERTSRTSTWMFRTLRWTRNIGFFDTFYCIQSQVLSSAALSPSFRPFRSVFRLWAGTWHHSEVPLKTPLPTSEANPKTRPTTTSSGQTSASHLTTEAATQSAMVKERRLIENAVFEDDIWKCGPLQNPLDSLTSLFWIKKALKTMLKLKYSKRHPICMLLLLRILVLSG